MTTQAVIFDCGGVICIARDESGRHKWEDRLGLPRDGLAQTVFESDIAQQCLLGKVTEDQVWQRMAVDFGLSHDQLAELRVDFWSGHWLNIDLIQFIGDLRPRYKTAILSNFWNGARQRFTKEFGLKADLVDEIILSSEEGLIKPDLQIYQLAARRLAVPPEAVIFVDDVAENVEGANRVGMSGVLFQNSAQTIGDIQKYLLTTTL